MVLDQATETEVIAASPQRCFEVAVDFERYPEWTHDVKEANVLERDGHGRATKVEYRAVVMVARRGRHHACGRRRLRLCPRGCRHSGDVFAAD
ncbi:MAG: hypothetical protein EBT46_04445 [Actinobacteria bacterium]|nr:hypothetical protein [Actinomycetota bacterium]